jgi:hypothetical protein
MSFGISHGIPIGRKQLASLLRHDPHNSDPHHRVIHHLCHREQYIGALGLPLVNCRQIAMSLINRWQRDLSRIHSGRQAKDGRFFARLWS